MNALPAALFARAAVYVQGALAGIFILGGLFSWSIKEWPARTIAELPRFGASLPPVWFTGLHQRLTGDPDPFFAAMAGRSWLAAGIVLALAILGYLVSYRRYRRLLLESPVRLAIPIAWRWSPLRWLARSPRREAIMDFMAKTLARSRTHRLLWLVYLGAAAAVLLNSSLIDGAILMRSHGWSKALRFLVLFWPLACSVVVLNGFRHVLSIPAELPANWIFQITEAHGRAEWMSAVERFVMAYAVAPIYLVLFPVAGYVLGWPMAVRMTVLQLLITLSIFETLFYSWQKLPFTCSHIPGERPLVGVVGKYVALLCALVPIVSLMIAIASQIWFLYPVYLASFGGIWIGLRRRRSEGWGEAKLIYEDAPAVVTDLGLKELTYAGTEAQLRRTVAGDAGYADSEESHSRPDARVRGHGIYPADLRGRPESGGGSALPGAAPPGTARPAGIGMGRLGEQPAGQILQPDAGGARISGGGGGPLAEDGGRHRPHHGTGLRVPPVVGFCHRLFFAFHRRQLDRDLEDELAFHLAMREAKYRSDGADDARTPNSASRSCLHFAFPPRSSGE